MRLILASTSPRRRDILALLRVPFETIAPEFNEQLLVHRSIADEVLEFAIGKAQSVARRHPGSIVIGSDTMILFDGQKIGKPGDEADARRMLRILSGKTHAIYTSVAIVDGGGGPGLRAVETVEVRMRHFSAEEVEGYLSVGESLDKAAAYSIQGHGRSLIQSIQGDYLAAVGMPLKPIAAYLEGRGIRCGHNIEEVYAQKQFLNWRSLA